jgi:hypothetical protein
MAKKKSIVSKASDTVRQTLTNEARNPSILTRFLGSMAGGPVVSGAMQAFSLLPINAQQVILKLAGLPTGLTEKDLNDDQKLALYNSVKSAQERNNKYKAGGTRYKDYGPEGVDIAMGKNGLLKSVYKSAVDPKFQMATTLGRTSYKNKGDSIIVTDSYDFSKGAFKDTPNPNAYQRLRRYMGNSEKPKPTEQQKKEMAVRIALNKADMEALNKKKNK